VHSGAEGTLNQLTRGTAGTFVAITPGQVVCLHHLRPTQPLIIIWWINPVPARIRQESLALLGISMISMHADARNREVLLAQTAILLYLYLYITDCSLEQS